MTPKAADHDPCGAGGLPAGFAEMQLDLHITASAAADWVHDLVIATIGIVGAVLGAVATGIVSDRAARAKAQQEQVERDKLASFSVRYGLLHIYARAMEHVRHFTEAREAAKTPGGEHFGLFLQPLANYPSRVEFPPADIYSLVRIGGPPLYNAVASLDLQHNSLIDAFQTFYAMQGELKVLVKGLTMKNGQVRGWMDMPEYESNQHRFLTVDDLFVQMERNANDLYLQSFSALREIVSAQATHFGQRVELRVPSLAGDDVTITGMPVAGRRGRAARKSSGPAVSNSATTDS